MPFADTMSHSKWVKDHFQQILVPLWSPVGICVNFMFGVHDNLGEALYCLLVHI